MPTSTPSTFLRKDWDLDLRAELYKEEFYATDAWTSQRDDLVAPWEGSTREELKKLLALKEGTPEELEELLALKAGTREALKKLLALKSERTAHMGEIIREQQGSVLITYCYHQLKFSAIDRPRTDELLHAAIYLAGSAVMYSKARFSRVRPWVLAPDLSPPIPLPGQPSYPGGHATQMHLMALMLSDLSPKDKGALETMAKNVARNRERAGLNYASDTTAGQDLAVRIWDILRSDCPNFASTLAQARNTEWP